MFGFIRTKRTLKPGLLAALQFEMSDKIFFPHIMIVALRTVKRPVATAFDGVQRTFRKMIHTGHDAEFLVIFVLRIYVT